MADSAPTGLWFVRIQQHLITIRRQGDVFYDDCFQRDKQGQKQKTKKTLNFSISTPLNLKLTELFQLMVWFYNHDLVLGDMYFLYSHLQVVDCPIRRSFRDGIYYIFFSICPQGKTDLKKFEMATAFQTCLIPQ